MNTVAECSNLEVRYGKTRALTDVSLSVQAGSVYALLGRNGAGKSSLVRCLLGQQKPESGEVQLFGEDAWSRRTQAMARTGVVPEEPEVPSSMSAEQVVSFCSRLYPRWDGPSVKARLERFQIPQCIPVGRLSKGQKAQLSLVLALGSNPELLVLDDPTLGMDAVARRELYQELLGDLADRGSAVFITTHDLAGIEGIADRVGILQKGKMALDEDLETLKGRFRRVRGLALDPVDRERSLKPFETLRAKDMGWGAEVLVTNFDEATFAEQRRASAFEGEMESLSLEEIFIAVSTNDEVKA